MLIGVPTETKDHENRVGLIPAAVRDLTRRGHTVLVQTGAGLGAGMTDQTYVDAGATIVPSAEDVFRQAELIVKVKEPQAAERKRLSPGQTLFTYLHLAADRDQLDALLASGCTAIAYETITAADGSLPLLTPMSEIAGRLAAQVAAHCLQKENGGRGILIGGVPGVPPADVVVLGGGQAGANAALIALGMGATVTVVDRSPDVLRRLSVRFGTALRTMYSSPDAVSQLCRRADVVIGTVLVPGARAAKLVDAETVRAMKPGAVIVDVSIDQGGCCETSRPTTHSNPTYTVDGVVHYCVTNMPAAVPRTSTFALNNATLPFVTALADKGWRRAMADDPHLRAGLNVHAGTIVCKAVADAFGMASVAAAEALSR